MAYEVVVDGHLDDRWSDWFGDVVIRRRADGTTSITALLVDQAQLHGLLAGLRDVGVVLTELRTLAPATGDDPDAT